MYKNFDASKLNLDGFVMTTLDPDRFDDVFHYYLRNRDWFAISFPDLRDDFYNPETFLKAMYKEFTMELTRKHYRLYIFDEADTEFKHILGDISFGNILRYPFDSCTVGYKIDEAVARRGIMKKCLASASNFALEEFKLHKLSAYVIPENEPSVKLLESLDWIFEGIDMEYAYLGGEWRDHYKYSLLSLDF